MDITSILDQRNVRCENCVGSKKHALDLLSEMLASAAPDASVGEILEGLANRERLGSTGLGRAVAMPHTRLAGIQDVAAAILKLDKPVDFGSADGAPVDLLFGLLVPEDPTSFDLVEVSTLVEHLRNENLQQQLRDAADPETLYSVLLRDAASPATTH